MMFYFIDCRIKNIAKLHDNSQTDELLWIKMGNNMSFVGVLSAWSYRVSRNSVGKRFHATPLICCDRFEIHRNKGLSVRRQNSSAL